MEAEHFNGLESGDFDVDDKKAIIDAVAPTSGTANTKAESAETDEMHGTRRQRRMLQAGD